MLISEGNSLSFKDPHFLRGIAKPPLSPEVGLYLFTVQIGLLVSMIEITSGSDANDGSSGNGANHCLA
jgi:hypothetical protein